MHAFIALLHPAARIGLTQFTVHPSTVIGLVGLGALYHWRALSHVRETATPRVESGARGAGLAVEPRTGDSTPQTADVVLPPSVSQRAMFFGALVLTFFNLNGWLHDLSDFYLFSAHMVQHLMLTLVVPPLLIMGTPGWMLRPALRYRAIASVARFVTSAPKAFLIFSVVLSAWHLPPIYEMAMENHSIHITQHLMFMIAATLMWWPVLSPMPELPRLSYPLQMLYLFLLTIPMSLVAICIGYADSILYPFYASAPRIMGITPMQDQLIGALIMWVPGGLFFFAIISIIFFRWQKHAEDSAESAQVGYRAV